MKSRTIAILIGSILGDGYLSGIVSKKETSSLALKYDSKYLGYLKWLHRELEELEPSPIKKKKGYHQYQFRTQARQDIGELRKIFYPTGTKVIPADIANYLRDPLTLAVWYQDDGCLDYRPKYHANVQLATHCFKKQECALLTKSLATNFALDARVCSCKMRGKQRYLLYVTSRSMNSFMQLVEPY